jgi:predicted amidophosphoribosyltransferase
MPSSKNTNTAEVGAPVFCPHCGAQQKRLGATCWLCRVLLDWESPTKRDSERSKAEESTIVNVVLSAMRGTAIATGVVVLSMISAFVAFFATCLLSLR